MGLKVLYKSFLLLIFAGMLFTDLPLFPEKTVTHSLMFIISPIIFIIILLIKNFKLNVNSFIIKIFFIYMVTTLFTSFLLLTYVFLKKGDLITFNKNLGLKLLEAFFSLTFLHFTVIYNFNFLVQKIDLAFLKKLIYITFLLLTVSAFIEYFSPTILDLFYASPKMYHRVRLFTMEPSQAALLYFVFASLSLFFCKKNVVRFLIFLLFIISSVFIASKGFFITLLVTNILLLIKNLKNVKLLPILGILTILSYYIFSNLVLPSIYIDIEKFSSFSTRVSGMISAVLILIFFPFGTGYGTYLYFYPDILEKSYNIANQIFLHMFSIPLSSVEIDSMISTGQNLGAKSGILQAIMFNGWFGLLVFLAIFLKLKSQIKNLFIYKNDKLILEFILYVIIIQLLIGSEYTLLYCVWLPLVLIQELNRLKGVKNEAQTSIYSSSKSLSSN